MLARAMASLSNIGMALGLLLGSWVGVQGLLLTVQSAVGLSRSRRHHEERRADFCRQVAATARIARATKSIPDWEGWRPFRVVAIVDEAADTKSFYLSPLDGRPLPIFLPGQYLTFRLHPPDSDAPVVRCYSLSDHPHEDFYRCTIKLVRPPLDRPELPAGRGSSCFHQHVHVGDVVEGRAPAGTFLLDSVANDPIVLIGAGIGITPLLSMVGATINSHRQRSMHLLLGFRNSQEHPFKGHLKQLAKEHGNLNVQVSYSAPLPNDVLYRDFDHEGRLSIERIREILPSNNFDFYLCGPGPMMESLVPELLAWGVPESHVHFEAFGPASVESGRSTGETVSQPCEVRFDRSDCDALWNGSHNSLLEFGEANGVTLASGCRAGSCGECLTALRSGKVRMLKASGVTVPDGHCLTCISVPVGPLVLDA
jgi:ferredoxin-NADP reductase